MSELVFLGGAVDCVDPTTRTSWREIATEHLNKHGFDVFSPPHFFKLASDKNATKVVATNKAAIEHCDICLAELFYNTPHHGTIAEIEHASNLGKRIVVWSDDDRPFYLKDRNKFEVYPTLKATLESITGVVKIKVFRDKSVRDLPMVRKQYAGDLGLDLPVSRDITIKSQWSEVISTDVRVALPEGYGAMMVSRSSTVQRGLRVDDAIIDNGWRGELFFFVRNETDKPIKIKRGDRLAQMILVPIPNVRVEEVETIDELGDSERGEKGFGSSGE